MSKGLTVQLFIVISCLLVAFQNCQKPGSSGASAPVVLASNSNGNGEGYTGTDSAVLELCSGTETPGALSPMQADQVIVMGGSAGTPSTAQTLGLTFSGANVVTFNFKTLVTRSITTAGASFISTGGAGGSTVDLQVYSSGSAVLSYTLTFPDGDVVTKQVSMTCSPSPN